MNDRRFEIKIPIPLNRLQQVQTWLLSHPYRFGHHYDDRFVNSLYLDTPHMTLYEENLSGISTRKKVRIRWYGDLDKAYSAKLEFKHRKAGKGFKHTFSTALNLESPRFSWFKALKACYHELPTEGRCEWGNEQMPVLICRYLREYFQCASGAIRATFDSNIEVFDQRYRSRCNLTKSKGLGEYVLLELKANEEHESQLSELVGTCPLRPSRHSKYVNGIRQLTWT